MTTIQNTFSPPILGGDNAFYNQLGYETTTEQDLAHDGPLDPCYSWNTESKIIRVAKSIFSLIIFPIAIYQALHTLAGLIIVPATLLSLQKSKIDALNHTRENIPLDTDWKYKRITIEMNGYKIEAMIMGKASTLDNKKWVLFSGGNCQFYEDILSGGESKEFLEENNANGIFFNYPGAGVSSGFGANRAVMANTCKAVRAYLINEIGVNNLIAYGHSIGGGVQADAFEGFEVPEGVKCVLVKSRTFSSLEGVVSIILSRILAVLVWALGWNMNPLRASEQLQIPEIILQTANLETYEELQDETKIIDDGVPPADPPRGIIPADASLGKAILEKKIPGKIVIGIPDTHNAPLSDISFLAKRIQSVMPA